MVDNLLEHGECLRGCCVADPTSQHIHIDFLGRDDLWVDLSAKMPASAIGQRTLCMGSSATNPSCTTSSATVSSACGHGAFCFSGLYCRKLTKRISDAPSSFFAAATPLSLGFISSFPPSPPEAPIGFVSSDSLAAGYRPVPVSPFPPSPRHNAPNAQIGFVSSFSLRPNNRQPHILA